MTGDAVRALRLSEILRSLDNRTNLLIGDLVDRLEERAFGALMFIFAVPNVIPMPPGTSALLGTPLIFLTYQLMMGRQSLWLPQKLRQKTIDGALVATFVRRTLPFLTKFERVLKPRLSFLAVPNIAERLIGAMAFCLAIILFLPIPFGNILPAAAIAVLALGLAERDGAAVVVGLLVATASLVVLGLVWSALYAAAETFIRVLFGL